MNTNKAMSFLRRYRQKRFFSRLIQKGHLCFDIGANVGVKSELLLSTGAKVIIVEPQQKCCEILHSKFDNNDQAIIDHSAIGTTNTTEELMVSNESQISTFSKTFIEAYSYQKEFNWNAREVVKMQTMDSLIEQHGIPHFCKIDVEGYEIEVLRGLSHKIPLISFEFNYPLKHLTIECIEVLEKFEPIVYNYVAYEKPSFALKKWVNSAEIKEIINKISPEIKTGDIYLKQVS